MSRNNNRREIPLAPKAPQPDTTVEPTLDTAQQTETVGDLEQSGEQVQADTQQPAQDQAAAAASAEDEQSAAPQTQEVTASPADEAQRRGETAPVATFDEAGFIPVSVVEPTPTYHRIMKNIERELTSYVEAMDTSKPADAKAGAAWQNTLFGVIDETVNDQDPESFRAKWAVLIKYFKEHREKLFNPNYIYRFQEGWSRSPVDYTRFRFLVHLLMESANPERSGPIHQAVNLTKITQALSPAAANNINNFYA